MTNCGLHLPNRAFHNNEWPRIQALNVRDYVDLDLFKDRWSFVLQQQSDARIHARVEARGALGQREQEATRLARLIQENPGIATWRYRNEPNLETRNLKPEDWQTWLTAFGRAVKSQAPAGSRVYAPAVSPGFPGSPDFLVWLDATVAGARDGGYDGLDIHAYGNPGEVALVLGPVRQRWSGSLLITEHNFGAGREYDLQKYADDLPTVLDVCSSHNAEAVCLFIWQWQNPDMRLPTTSDVKDTPIERVISSLPHREPPFLPQPVPVMRRGRHLNHQELMTYSRWAAARLANDEDPRDVLAFLQHLRNLGADANDPARFGLPLKGPKARLNKFEMKVYSDWAAQRIAHNEDPRNVAAFRTHLKAIGADENDPYRYGFPFVEQGVIPNEVGGGGGGVGRGRRRGG